MALKPPDSTCLPLCGEEHHRNGVEAWHRLGRVQFEQRHGINVDAEILRFNRAYEMTGAKLASGKSRRPKRVAKATKTYTNTTFAVVIPVGKPQTMSERLRELREKRAR